MNNYKLQIGFFTVLLAGVLLLSFFVLKPYLAALFLAVILRIAFAESHEKIFRLSGERANLAAFLSVLVIILFIVVPVALVSLFVFDDARNLYLKALAGDIDFSFASRLTELIEGAVRGFIPDFSLDPLSHVREGLTFFLRNIGSVFSGAATLALDFFLMLLALFYLFRDGARFRKYIVFLSPLENSYDENILKRLSDALRALVKGSLLIALIQGVLSALGFLIFGVPNAVLWGAVAAVAALVPTFGTMLILAPAIVYLFWAGSLASGLGLLVWGAVVVGLVDNVLAPYLLTKGLNVHPFLILVSVLGGFLFFGPVGFLVGPVLVTLLMTLLEMYPDIASGKSISSKTE